MEIKANAPGKIEDIHVSVGDSITKDKPIVTLESMKVEQTINAPISGVIKEINVSVGDFVEKDQLLIVMEYNFSKQKSSSAISGRGVFLEKFILFSRTLPYLHYKVSHVSGRHLHNEGSSSRQ